MKKFVRSALVTALIAGFAGVLWAPDSAAAHPAAVDGTGGGTTSNVPATIVTTKLEAVPQGDMQGSYQAVVGDQERRLAGMKQANSLQRATAQARPGYDDVTFDECSRRNESLSQGGYVKNRYAWCQRTLADMHVNEVNTGRYLGQILFRMTIIFYGTNGDRFIQYDARLDRFLLDPVTPLDWLALAT
ncbi:MAG: hypothetical protein AUI14_12435 [Actinobacteria bacterium 13_2_20CM_2_71_6]|nr:MAG: hypothetical protein AUI14_12435 [Actinobacteria bacterium 13_2_20CM_2_71_6]